MRSGVPRLVLLSGRGEAEAERAEQAVRASGADVTILRSTWFAQNFSESYWVDMVSGKVALPAGDTPEPFVDGGDLADVAVAAHTGDRHIGQLYELTGPRLLTFAEAVAEIATATGREVRYVPVSVQQYAAAAVGQGVPSEVIDLLTYLFGEVLDGRNAHLADGVQRALGREPRLRRLRATPPPVASGTLHPQAGWRDDQKDPSADRCGGGGGQAWRPGRSCLDSVTRERK